MSKKIGVDFIEFEPKKNDDNDNDYEHGNNGNDSSNSNNNDNDDNGNNNDVVDSHHNDNDETVNSCSNGMTAGKTDLHLIRMSVTNDNLNEKRLESEAEAEANKSESNVAKKLASSQQGQASKEMKEGRSRTQSDLLSKDKNKKSDHEERDILGKDEPSTSRNQKDSPGDQDVDAGPIRLDSRPLLDPENLIEVVSEVPTPDVTSSRRTCSSHRARTTPGQPNPVRID